MRVRDPRPQTSTWVLLLLAQLQALGAIPVKHITLDIWLTSSTDQLTGRTWASILVNLLLLMTRPDPDAGRVVKVSIVHHGPVNFHVAMERTYVPLFESMYMLDFLEIIDGTV